MEDPFGRALRDHHLGQRGDPLIQRAGDRTLEHPIEAFYFADFDPSAWAFPEWLAGPLLDAGAGTGRHALVFQDDIDVVALEISEPLVQTMRDRGVRQVHQGDMFALREAFSADRFESVLIHGTQIGLVGSMQGLRGFLRDLAHVTVDEGIAIIDGYDPDHPDATELLGYRNDPFPGMADRVMRFEYAGATGDQLSFRLFSPARFEAACADTGWEVVERLDPERTAACHYQLVIRQIA